MRDPALYNAMQALLDSARTSLWLDRVCSSSDGNGGHTWDPGDSSDITDAEALAHAVNLWTDDPVSFTAQLMAELD